MADGRIWLLTAGWMSITAALLHFAWIIGGPDWYRFMGAGEGIAKAAEAGSWTPAILTTIIATIIMGWAAYAFSAAGILPRLPLLRTGLFLVSLILLLRSFSYFVRDAWRPDLSHSFMAWSSAITLVMGLTFAIGLFLSWNIISKETA